MYICDPTSVSRPQPVPKFMYLKQVSFTAGNSVTESLTLIVFIVKEANLLYIVTFPCPLGLQEKHNCTKITPDGAKTGKLSSGKKASTKFSLLLNVCDFYSKKGMRGEAVWVSFTANTLTLLYLSRVNSDPL